jgi:hypothetical protein
LRIECELGGQTYRMRGCRLKIIQIQQETCEPQFTSLITEEGT